MKIPRESRLLKGSSYSGGEPGHRFQNRRRTGTRSITGGRVLGRHEPSRGCGRKRNQRRPRWWLTCTGADCGIFSSGWARICGAVGAGVDAGLTAPEGQCRARCLEQANPKSFGVLVKHSQQPAHKLDLFRTLPG